MARIRQLSDGRRIAHGASAEGPDVFIYLRRGEVRAVKIDLKEFTGSGSILSVAVSGDMTLPAPTHASGIVSASITGPSGLRYADISATLSTGEIVTQRIIAREIETQRNRDYLGYHVYAYR